MSESLFPRRYPAEIAAELFRSCQWEEAGDPFGSAHKAAYCLFQELIQRMGAEHPRARELHEQIAAAPDAPGVEALRREMQTIVARVGVGRAKYIFQHFAKPPSTTDLNDRKNYAVLDRFDRGVWDEKTRKWRPCSMLELAKLLAKENEALPLEERKGPGGVDVPALAKHIENQVKRRERELEAGTWFGPITHEQAIRHFGAQNVATSEGK
jgi:hypothetical protein